MPRKTDTADRDRPIQARAIRQNIPPPRGTQRSRATCYRRGFDRRALPASRRNGK